MSTRKRSLYAETGEKIVFEGYQWKFIFVTIMTLSHFWVLSCFLAYLRQFKSKSHIQWYHWKAEIQGFHLTPSMMGLHALLMEIWAIKKRRKVCWPHLYIVWRFDDSIDSGLRLQNRAGKLPSQVNCTLNRRLLDVLSSQHTLIFPPLKCCQVFDRVHFLFCI